MNLGESPDLCLGSDVLETPPEYSLPLPDYQITKYCMDAQPHVTVSFSTRISPCLSNPRKGLVNTR